MIPNEMDEEIEEWKQEQIEAHRKSGHRFVTFTRRHQYASGRFTFQIDCGGYETYPDWMSGRENVEVVSISDESTSDL